MRKLLTILYVVLAIEVFVITSSAVIGQFQQKPMLGIQVDGAHPLGDFVSAWLFNEGSGNKVFDLSGNGNTGTLQGDTHFVPGKFGSALDFDGTGDYVGIGKAVLSGYPYTLVAYGKPDTTGERVFISISDKSVNDIYIYIRYSDAFGAYNFQRRNSATPVDCTGGAATGGYDHVVAVARTPTDVELFVNGISVATSIGSVTWNSNIDQTSIGVLYRLDAPTTSLFVGQIDHIMIYNRALSASEIAELYREPFGMFVKDDIAILATAAVPPPPPTGQVITIIQSAIPLFLIFTLVCLIRGRKSVDE